MNADLTAAERDAAEIRPVVDGETLILDELGFDFSFRAMTDPEEVDYVRWYVNGNLVQTERQNPYSLCGESGQWNYNSCNSKFPSGTYIIEAIPELNGVIYSALKMQITIKQSSRRELLPNKAAQKETPDDLQTPLSVSELVAKLKIHGDPRTVSFNIPIGKDTPEFFQDRESEPRTASFNTPVGKDTPSPIQDTEFDMYDEETYCLSSDFPCQSGGISESMVYICLYSSYGGYQTLCIPEDKSDILQYYDTSYCGQCVGGLKAILNKVFSGSNE